MEESYSKWNGIHRIFKMSNFCMEILFGLSYIGATNNLDCVNKLKIKYIIIFDFSFVFFFFRKIKTPIFNFKFAISSIFHIKYFDITRNIHGTQNPARQNIDKHATDLH